MGLDTYGVEFLKYCSTKKEIKNILTLGNQGLAISKNHLKKQFKLSEEEANYYSNQEFCSQILIEKLGVLTVKSIDNSAYQGAEIIHDLNQPLPTEKKGICKYDTILDLGTLEHIFNIPQALINITNLCKSDGQIIHCLPADGYCGHGLYQFSPELFFSYYSPERGYKDTEIFFFKSHDKSNWNTWYKVNKPANGKRIELSNFLTNNSLSILVRTVKTSSFSNENIQQSDYSFSWDLSNPEESSQRQEAIIQNKFVSKATFKKYIFNFLNVLITKDQIMDIRRRIKKWYKHPCIRKVNSKDLIN